MPTKKATYTQIMVDMEGCYGVGITMNTSIPSLTYKEDGTGPCWAWIYDWVDTSDEDVAIG